MELAQEHADATDAMVFFFFFFSEYDLRTAGHVAAGMGHREVLVALRDAGADFSVKDRWGGSARSEVAEHFPELVSVLG
jgi:hypothetical protein